MNKIVLLNKRLQEVAEYIKTFQLSTGNRPTMADISQRFNCSKTTSGNYVAQLKKKGILTPRRCKADGVYYEFTGVQIVLPEDIPDLMKRIDMLEKRVAKLEKKVRK